MLQYVAGADTVEGGKINVVRTEVSGGKKETLTFTFKALKVGSSNITVSGYTVCPTDPSYGDKFSTTVSNGKVTVKAPYQASTNASLASLSVGEGTLSPAFAKDKYNYSVQVGGGVDSITVSAKAADSKAKVSISGNKNLAEGDNTVKVVVTAEDGSTKKTYTIVVTRAKPSPTPTPTTGISRPVGEETHTLLSEITVTIPEGFEESFMEYEGYQIATLTSLVGNLTLVQMDDDKLYQ